MYDAILKRQGTGGGLGEDISLRGTSHVAYITASLKRAKPETSKMADNRKEEFPKCSTLFLSEDGSPMLFYMTPSAMKTKLRPLIRVRDS